MNFGRLAVAAVAAWMASLGLGYLAHDILLADTYANQVASLRPTGQASPRLPLGLGSTLIGFFVFAYAFAKGYEGGSGVQEGLRFGVLVGLMLICFGIVWQYIRFPVSTGLLAAWVVDYIVEFAIYGMIVGGIYRPHPARSPA